MLRSGSGRVCTHAYQLPVWPTNLVTCALFNTLHSQHYAGMGNRGGISRERFFFYGFLASTCWYFFPGYIFQALSFFNWVCWIAPDNIVVNQLFGYSSGLVSITPITLVTEANLYCRACR